MEGKKRRPGTINRPIHVSGNTRIHFKSNDKKRVDLNDVVFAKMPQYNVSNIKAKETGTASETFDIVLHEEIAKGRLKTNKGIGKKKITKAGVNSSANNIGLGDEENPRMIARQVASWKVARALDLRVLSTEKYALDDDGNIIGVSALVPTARSLSAEMKHHTALIEQNLLSPIEGEQYMLKHVFTGNIQKQLSDLQLIDALTGQTDRHHGNIFIDTTNQKIYGIDNDQAFINNTNREFLNAKNALVSWRLPHKLEMGKTLPQDDKNKELIYLQNQIDADTAEKVLAMTPEQLRLVLEDRIGVTYGEFLNTDEKIAAQDRLEAIKRQIRILKANNKLIHSWDEKTYMDSLEIYGQPLTFLQEIYEVNESQRDQRHTNYVAREIYTGLHRTDLNGAIEIFDITKTESELLALYGNEGARIISPDGLSRARKMMTRNDVRLGRKGLSELQIKALEAQIKAPARGRNQIELEAGEFGYEADNDVSSRKLRRRKLRRRKAR